MRIWADIEDISHNIVGDGPIVNLLNCKTTTRLSRVGEFSFDVPAMDERVDLIQARRAVLIYGMVNGEKTYLGGGTIDDIRTRMGADGIPILSVSGGDFLEELTRISVGKMTLTADGDTNISVLMAFITAAPLAWGTDRETGSPNFQARLVYETAFNSLFAVAEKTGAYFRFDGSNLPTRALKWFYTISSSGILATLHGDPVAIESNPNVCLISDIEIDQDSSDLKTRAFLFGSGEGESITTARYAANWPDLSPLSITPIYTVDGQQYEFSRTGNYIRNITAETAYGRDEIALAFKDIAPITNNPVDLIATSNYLITATLEYLHKNYKPFVSYRLSVAGLKTVLLPGQTILVQARRFRDGEKPININETLYILEVQNTIDSNGIHTSGLTVANMLRWPVNDGEIIAREMAKTNVMSAHPQTGPNVDTIPYREHLDDDHTATMHFWLGEETTTVQSVIVRFRVDPLGSTVTTVAGDAAVAIGGTINISHTHPIPNHIHTTNVIASTPGDAPMRLSTSGTSGFLEWDGAGTKQIFSNNTGGTTSDAGGSPTLALTGTVDLSDAVHVEYGVFDQDLSLTYAATDLEWKTEADAGWTAVVVGNAISGASDWYGIDITPNIVTDGRPDTAVNNVQFQVKAASHADKTAQLTVQIERRTSIQSIAVY